MWWNIHECGCPITCIIIVLLLVFQGFCKTSESLFCHDEARLYNQLFNNTYDPRQRPGNCSGEPVDVEMSMWLQGILTLDESDEVFTASSWIQLQWLDERLSWNPDEYNDVEYLTIDTASIWTPVLVLENAVGSFQELISSSVGKATLTPDGYVYVDFPLIHATSCRIVIKYFPFDIQNCLVQFSAQRVSISHSNLRAGDINGNIGGKFKQWFINALSSRSFSVDDIMKRSPQLSFSVVEFNIKIERYATYHLVTNAFPVMLLSIIGVFIFLIPPESGERLSVGVSVLLGLTFFEMLVSDALPVSTSPPLLGIFWLGSFLIVAVSFLLSLISVNIHNWTDNIQGHTKRRILLEILPKLCCVSVDKKAQFEHESNNIIQNANVVYENAVATNEFSSSGNDSAVGSVNAVSLRTLQQSEISKDDNHYSTGMEYSSASQVGCNKQEVTPDYKTVTKVLDRFFFILISLAYVMFSFIVLTRRP